MRPAAARIVGAGATPLTGPGPARGGPGDAVGLCVRALRAALDDAGMALGDLDTLIALPPLMGSGHMMAAHAVAQAAGLTPRRGLLCRTLDVGGAGPVAALLAAARAVQHEGRAAVAVVAGDAVASVPTAEFLARADAACRPREGGVAAVPSPVIPHLYDRVAAWHMATRGTTREQLAMCASLMTLQASRHPGALERRPRPLAEVLASPPVASVTTKLECARRADGAAALIVAAAGSRCDGPAVRVSVLGGGEGSGPLVPPAQLSEECFSAASAAAAAYAAAGLAPSDIDHWGLYDCFPVCFVRAIEAVGLAPDGGRYVEQQYARLLGPAGPLECAAAGGGGGDERAPAPVWPVNTHGGLLGGGAPWEAPAAFSLVEAVTQLRGEAAGRQVAGARHALVYANGGVFSASAVAILEGGVGGRAGPSRL
ncbi:hypothetical protein HT031_004675 [Scenedesmus sp. PABB004]|nr:hypothetical protein HT031_004675 [Scenedesmus sp. PABB004]